MDLQVLRAEAIRLEDVIDTRMDGLRRYKSELASACDVYDISKRSTWGEEELRQHEKKCIPLVNEIEQLVIQVTLILVVVLLVN